MTIALFPVRHHSPRASAALARYLDRVQPELVLVEGPRDATRLIPFLLDADTVPPVAILGYRTEGSAHSMLYPFATYSPEYVALRWALDHAVRAELIDITTGEALAAERDDGDDDGGDGGDDGDGDDDHDNPHRVAAERDLPPSEDDAGPTEDDIAKAQGFRSFEELWEAWFEAPDHAPEDFVKALLAWGELVRSGDRVEYHRGRDARMMRHIREAIASGIAPSKIAVVVGAAHAAAFAAGDVDPALEAMFTPSVPTELTIIPYSFTRLAGQLGYGAGNRAPRYYQKAHDAGCDYTRATLEVLIEFTEHLRVRGFAASLADTIEAYRLAVTLAAIRDKHAPGLDEIREATIATMCRGEASHVDAFLWPAVIGKTVGKVGARIGKSSLQTEFWREAVARGLPRSDEPEDFTLKLGDPLQIGTSVFLHRLRLADIPYASYGGSQAFVQRGPVDDEAGGVAALSRVREHWTAQWTPATDVALVERIVYGDTLLQVAERRLGEALAAATGTASAAYVLLEAVVAGAPQVMPEALAATERLAATDDDVLSLARATRALSGLVSYGTSRASIAGAERVIGELADKTFTRAVLRIEGASIGDDGAVQPARDAIRILHEIAVSQTRFDTSLWFTIAGELVTSERIHGACAGMLAGLMYLTERLDEAALTTIVGFRLSNTADPGAAAAFLEGFLSVNALVLVKNRAIVEALDAFVQAVEVSRFRDVLPVLRRAFSGLGASERRYLLENLLSNRRIGEHARAATQVLASKDIDKLKAMSEDITRAMDDLDDLL